MGKIQKFLSQRGRDVLIYVLLGLFTAFYLYLISKTFFIDQSGNIRTAFSGYGDIPLHLSQMTKFAFNKFSFEEPIFSGTNIQYPFMINLISAFFLKLTHSWVFSFLFPVLILGALGVFLSFKIYSKLLANRLLALLSVIVFYLGSGMGAYRYIVDAFREHLTINGFINQMTTQNISTIISLDQKYPDQNLVYGAPLSLTIHQRPFFIGFFAFILFLWLLWKFLEAKEKPKYLTIITGIVYGLMPIFHMHSFIAASIMFAVIFVILLLEKRGRAASVIPILLIGFVIALPQVAFLIGGKDVMHAGANFVSMRLGWMSQETIGAVNYGKEMHSVFSLAYLKFIWVNFGIILPLFLLTALGLVFSRKIKNLFIANKAFKVFVLIGLVLFIIANIFRFQPWDFDNNKILVYYQFFAVPVVFFAFAKLFKNKFLKFSTILIFFLIATFSGVSDQIFRFFVAPDSMPVIFNTDSRELANFILKNVPQQDLILTGTSHLNPVDSLAGRPVLVGYPGWLWTRGINYGEREADIRAFYANPKGDSPILKKYNIKFALVDDQSVSELGARPALFATRFEEVFGQGQYHLYKVE